MIPARWFRNLERITTLNHLVKKKNPGCHEDSHEMYKEAFANSASPLTCKTSKEDVISHASKDTDKFGITGKKKKKKKY